MKGDQETVNFEPMARLREWLGGIVKPIRAPLLCDVWK
jgi:hypothetical protein